MALTESEEIEQWDEQLAHRYTNKDKYFVENLKLSEKLACPPVVEPWNPRPDRGNFQDRRRGGQGGGNWNRREGGGRFNNRGRGGGDFRNRDRNGGERNFRRDRSPYQNQNRDSRRQRSRSPDRSRNVSTNENGWEGEEI